MRLSNGVTDLPTHRLELALVHPQIAPNTGNVARLCVATGTRLHLVRPMGFVLDDRRLRRSALDYWPRLALTVHDDLTAFRSAVSGRSLWLFDSTGDRGLWEAEFRDGDVLVFGSETSGLPAGWLSEAVSRGRCVRLPQRPGERCLNLATSAGIGLYEALRRVSGVSARASRG